MILPSIRTAFIGIALLSAVSVGGAVRVAPYLQNPTRDGISVIWFSDSGNPGILRVNGATFRRYTSSPKRARALAYHPAEHALASHADTPFRHRVRLQELLPGQSYSLHLEQDGQVLVRRFRMPPGPEGPIRFVVYADSETEPESTGSPAAWPAADGYPDRCYVVDQTEGYRRNLRLMAAAEPAFVVVSGDLVQSGGEQRDWDEFWRLNANEPPHLASLATVFPAIGNHEVFGGPGAFGGYDEWKRALAKYMTYFELPADRTIPRNHRGHYYRADVGPVTLITLDSSNGLPENSVGDTNFYLTASDDVPPDFHPGSTQYIWLERQLVEARLRSKFTFVQFHHSPYSEGPHGLPAGTGPDEDRLSGFPLRVLTPLFVKYGVAAVFGGHCEMYEHSVVQGVHFYDIGIGGDGLRAPHLGKFATEEGLRAFNNPHQVFLAHGDAPEKWDDRKLLEGGRHYGHLQVDVFIGDDGRWKARLAPVYAFPVITRTGNVIAWERRLYDDIVVLDGPAADSQAGSHAAPTRRGARRKNVHELSPRTRMFGYVAMTFVGIMLACVLVAVLRRVC